MNYQVLFFKKYKDYFITSMACYVDLAAGIEELSQYVRVKEISNLANDILTNGIDSGYEMTI